MLEEGTANKFHPFYHQALKEIKSIDFSKITKIESSFGNDALGGKKLFGYRLKKINHEKRLFSKKLDGGSILDCGIYPISFLIDILYLFQNNLINNFILNDCKKKKSNDVDIESSINMTLNKIKIQFQTSLINKLKNNFEIHTDNEKITFENIFTIDASSAVTYAKDHSKNIFNKNKENVYFYEINEISNFLINQNNQSLNTLNKLESKIELLSSWFNY